MGPQGSCWQGRRSCGPTRFSYGCHTVVLMCTRDASFGAQLDEEESWTGMIAVMLHLLSIKSGAPRLLTAVHRAAQWSQTLSQLTAYHSGTGNPMELPNGYETRIDMTESVDDGDYHGDDIWSRQVLWPAQLGGSADSSPRPGDLGHREGGWPRTVIRGDGHFARDWPSPQLTISHPSRAVVLVKVTRLCRRAGKGDVSRSMWNIVQASLQASKAAQLNSADAGAVASGVVSASGAKTTVGRRICWS